jgi:hypothetical protein
MPMALIVGLLPELTYMQLVTAGRIGSAARGVEHSWVCRCQKWTFGAASSATKGGWHLSAKVPGTFLSATARMGCRFSADFRGAAERGLALSRKGASHLFCANYALSGV